MNRPAAGLDHVMFGHSALFGDYVDIIHANGGRLLKVVTNLPDLPRPGDGRRFADDLAAMNGWLAHAKGAPEIARQDIDAFAPAAGETYLIGFRGEQLRPLRDRLKKDFGLVFSALCHPAAAISPTAGIGEGAIIGANSVLGSFSQAGEFCLINRGATVGHGTRIGAFANIAPGADIASGVTVGQGAAIGIGARVIDGMKIGARAFVTAGAVVTRDVEADTTVAGMPARRVRRLGPSETP